MAPPTMVNSIYTLLIAATLLREFEPPLSKSGRPAPGAPVLGAFFVKACESGTWVRSKGSGMIRRFGGRSINWRRFMLNHLHHLSIFVNLLRSSQGSVKPIG